MTWHGGGYWPLTDPTWRKFSPSALRPLERRRERPPHGHDNSTITSTSRSLQVIVLSLRQFKMRFQRPNCNLEKFGFSFVQLDIQSEKLLQLLEFDLVHCAGVFYHVENPLSLLFRLRKLCHHDDGYTLVAFGIGPRLPPERDPNAALHESRDRHSGVAMGFRFQCHGGSHSPTVGLVWSSSAIRCSGWGTRQSSLAAHVPIRTSEVRFNYCAEPVQVRAPAKPAGKRKTQIRLTSLNLKLWWLASPRNRW